MKLFHFAVFVLVAGVAFALFTGGWWAAAPRRFVRGLLGAMNYHMPLLDWLYPPDEKRNERD